MKIKITMELDDEYADPDHPMGISDEGYEKLVEALNSFGEDVNVEQA